MKTKSLIVSIILLIAISFFPTSVMAQSESDFVTSGEYTYTEILDDDGNGTGKIILYGYTGTDVDVVVPETIDDKVVTELSCYVFYQNATVKSVTLPDTLKKIFTSAFYDCANLETIVIPEGIEVIDKTFFMYCPSLVNYTIPSDLEELGKKLNISYLKVSTVTLNGAYNYDLANEVITLINQARVDAGKYEYIVDDEIMSFGITRAPEIAIYMGHERPCGLSTQSLIDFQYIPCNEIIGGGQTSAEEIVNQWLGSEYHRPTIMSEEYNVCGAGCYYVDGNYYWVFAATVKEVYTTEDSYQGVVDTDVDVKISKYYNYANLLSVDGLETTTYMEVDQVIEPEYVVHKNIAWGSVHLNPNDVKWESSDPEVFTVDENGKITAVSLGTATLTVSLLNSSIECEIIVTDEIKKGEIEIIYEDTNGSVLLKETMTGVVGTTYEVNIRDIYNYELKEVIGETELTYTEEKQTVTIVMKKINGRVIVNLTDENNEVLQQIIEEGKIGEEYTIELPDIEGYYTPEETTVTGTYKERDTIIEVIYEEIPKGDVEIIYEDIEGNELLKETMTGEVGSTYEVTIKEIDNYELKETIGNLEGTYKTEKQTVTIVMEKIKGKVIVNLVDEAGETLDQIVKEGYVEEEYTIELPEIEGYYTPEETTLTGTYQVEETTLNIVYNKILIGEVEIIYEDIEGIELEKEIITGEVGTEYQVTAKQIDNYELKETIGNLEGTYTEEKQTIRFVMEKIKGKVIVNLVDENGEILDQIIKEGNVGEEYIVELPEIDGYYTEETTLTGTYQVEETTLEVVYKEVQVIVGKVIVNLVDENGETLDQIIKEGNVGEEYIIELPEIEGYYTEETTLTGTYQVEETTLEVVYKEVQVNVGKVIVNLVDENGETLDQIIKEGNIGEEYTIELPEIDGYYTEETTLTGTYQVEETTLEVVYKEVQVNVGKVIVNLVNENGETLDQIIKEGNVGEEYIVELPEIDGYYTEETTLTGTYEIEETTLEVVYKVLQTNIGLVEIIYEDIEGTELLKETLTGEIGTEYQVTAKQIDNYELKETIGNLEGTYTEEKQTIRFVMEKIKGKVIVNLVDEAGETLDQIIKEGNVGEEYIVVLPEIEGYYTEETTLTGTYQVEETTLEVVYKEVQTNIGLVEIIYEDTEGTELLKETLTGEIGTEYQITVKQLSNYELKETIGNLEGTYTEEKQTVRFVMEKIKGKVTVNLVDENGEILDQIIKEGNVGEEYIVELPEIDGYYTEEETTLTGTYQEEEITLDVVYKEKSESGETVYLGDVNRDGNVDSADAAIVLNLFKYNNATEEELKLGDMDQNGLIDSADAALILNYFKYNTRVEIKV